MIKSPNTRADHCEDSGKEPSVCVPLVKAYPVWGKEAALRFRKMAAILRSLGDRQGAEAVSGYADLSC